MTALERHRENWKGQSDEWLFERLDRELKDKVDTIHRLLSEIESLKKQAPLSSCKKQYFVEYKEWQDSIHWQLNGGWVVKSKVVEVFSAIELNSMFDNIVKIKSIP
jgi:hypothetical protein